MTRTELICIVKWVSVGLFGTKLSPGWKRGKV